MIVIFIKNKLLQSDNSYNLHNHQINKNEKSNRSVNSGSLFNY